MQGNNTNKRAFVLFGPLARYSRELDRFGFFSYSRDWRVSLSSAPCYPRELPNSAIVFSAPRYTRIGTDGTRSFQSPGTVVTGGTQSFQPPGTGPSTMSRTTGESH